MICYKQQPVLFLTHLCVVKDNTFCVTFNINHVFFLHILYTLMCYSYTMCVNNVLKMTQNM